GNFLPIYLNADEYFSTRQSFGEEYITSLSNIMQPWTAPLLLVGCFVFGVIGALIGKKLLKKHFVKAGIA
ncbi:MAG: MptD family putative ECF transporter S component, partial [Porcipelethomonas sp.]